MYLHMSYFLFCLQISFDENPNRTFREECSCEREKRATFRWRRSQIHVPVSSMTCSLTIWLTVWLTDWLTLCLTAWLIDSLNRWLPDWLDDSMIDLINGIDRWILFIVMFNDLLTTNYGNIFFYCVSNFMIWNIILPKSFIFINILLICLSIFLSFLFSFVPSLFASSLHPFPTSLALY